MCLRKRDARRDTYPKRRCERMRTAVHKNWSMCRACAFVCPWVVNRCARALVCAGMRYPVGSPIHFLQRGHCIPRYAGMLRRIKTKRPARKSNRSKPVLLTPPLFIAHSHSVFSHRYRYCTPSKRIYTRARWSEGVDAVLCDQGYSHSWPYECIKTAPSIQPPPEEEGQTAR